MPVGQKVAEDKVWNQYNRAHAVSACIGLWRHRLMHSPHRLMHVLHELPHDITGWCMQLLHGLCCFDFVLDIYTFISSNSVLPKWQYHSLVSQILCRPNVSRPNGFRPNDATPIGRWVISVLQILFTTKNMFLYDSKLKLQNSDIAVA